jgi:hypothetical protein
VRPGASYLSSNDPRAHVTFATNATIQGLSVDWPDGTRERFDAPASGRTIAIHQGTGKPDPMGE